MKEMESRTLARMAAHLSTSARPVVCCSFGKDSIVALHLALRIKKKVPVLFFRHAKFQAQFEHAYQVAREWDLEVFDLMPSATIEYQQGDYFEILDFYRCGLSDNIIMVDGIRAYKPSDGERYFCAIDDFLLRPKALATDYPWDLTIMGSKEGDPFHLADRSGPMMPCVQYATTMVAFPLSDWTDDDVWAYIAHYDLPFDRRRYVDNIESVNPDRMVTCYNCLNSNHRGEQVSCPKRDGALIPNIARSFEEHEATRAALFKTLKYCTPVGEGMREQTT